MSQPMKILVVDDVPQNLLAMEALLAEVPDLQVITAASGPAALEQLLINEVGLALLDVQMPGMDGYALAELMRGAERTRHVPIIFLTAGSQDQRRSFRGYEAGAVDFLYKPLDPQVLLSKVRVFADLHAQRRLLNDRMVELKRVQRLNEMMIAAMSHDLRTPLMAVALNAEVVHRRGTTDALVQAGGRIKANGVRMTRMIDHLVNFVRMPSELPQLDLARGDLREVIGEQLGELASAWPEVEVVTSMHGDTHLAFDAARMAQALHSLLGQALQHAGPGTTVRLTLDGDRRHQVTLTIHHDGELPEETSMHLFATPGITEGLEAAQVGLGLYMADHLVRAHGGSLLGRSSAAHGTEYELILPRAV